MFRIAACCLVLLVVGTGCRQKEEIIVSDATELHYKQMAVDTAYRINASFPAVKSVSFSIFDKGDDGSYGVYTQALIEKLKELGYTVYVDFGNRMGKRVTASMIHNEREVILVLMLGNDQYVRAFDLLENDISPSSYWTVRRGAPPRGKSWIERRKTDWYEARTDVRESAGWRN